VVHKTALVPQPWRGVRFPQGFAHLPQTFAGQGKQVSTPFFMDGGKTKFCLMYDGAGPFKVDLLDNGLNGLKLADFDGSIRRHFEDVFASGPLSGPGNNVLEINAGGTYTITVEQ